VLTQTEAILKSLPAIVQANRIDALIIDTVQFYAELGAMQLGIPYVHVANAVHFDYSGYTPLCCYGWPHETTPAALARNREGVAKWASLLESVNEGIKAHARSVGLNIDWNDLSSGTALAAPEAKGAKADIPYGIPVPGKQGFVTSPFAPDSGYIDVRQFPPRTDVKDPFTGNVFRTP
jgi:hypothetical protein